MWLFVIENLTFESNPTILIVFPNFDLKLVYKLNGGNWAHVILTWSDGGMAWCYTYVRFSSQDAVSKLRGIGNGYSRSSGESYESLQSKARELEKKVC